MIKKAAVRASPALGAFPWEPPVPVRRPVMLHSWTDVGFVHWPFEPRIVQALLPESVTVDRFDGAAWVGLVPFHVTIRTPGLPRLPWASSFEEMNVRTYVRGPDGIPGVWFITLDAARLGAVLIARASYRLRYCWSKMNFSRIGDAVTYVARRRWPQPRGALGAIALQIGATRAPEDLTDLERWLVARWCFYCTMRGKLYRAYVEHEPWPLAAAQLVQCDPGLASSCGLPHCEGDPITHYSPGVEVRMGLPHRVTS